MVKTTEKKGAKEYFQLLNSPPLQVDRRRWGCAGNPIFGNDRDPTRTCYVRPGEKRRKRQIPSEGEGREKMGGDARIIDGRVTGTGGTISCGGQCLVKRRSIDCL